MADAVDVRRKVLVVDADQSTRSLVYLTLHGERIDVVEAADGDEAMAAVDGGGLDVALVDLRLPGDGGADLAARVKEADADIRTVLLVRKADLGDVPADTVVDAVLTKPFTSLALLKKVDELLERS